EPPHPLQPIIARAVGEIAASAFERTFERLIGAEHHVHRPRQHERRLVLDVRQRRVCGESYWHLVAPETNVIAAGRPRHHRLAIAMCRSKADGDPRHAAGRLDDADELRRTKGAAVNLEARREVGDTDSAALVVDQVRDNGCSIAHIVRSRLNLTIENNIGETLLVVAGKQSTEHRIAVVAWHTPPHDPRRRIEQRRGAAVTDDRKIESVICHAAVCPLAASAFRASRTWAGFLNIPVRPGKRRLTLKPLPPISGKILKTDSSVTSSPMKIGIRQLNGACAINFLMLSPLFTPGRN